MNSSEPKAINQGEEALLGLPGPSFVPTRGPLRISSRRPTVFEDADGRAVWLSGMIVAGGPDGKPVGGWPLVSFGAMDDLAAHNGNYVHVRLGPFVRALEGAEYEAYAHVGDGQYNLDQWNPAFWQRVRNVISYARARGVYVEVDLVDAWTMKVHGRSPWHAGVNVNGAAYACGNMTPAGQDRHIRWLEKIIDEIGDFDNVIFEVGNETSTCGQMGTIGWESLVVNTVRNRLGPNRPRLFSTNSENGAIENAGFIDYVNRHNPADGPPIAIDLAWGKPAGVNEYGDGNPNLYTRELWTAFTKGTFLHYWWGLDGGTNGDNQRPDTFKRIHYFHGLIGKTDFAGFEAAPIINGRLVGRRHHEFLGFLQGPGTIPIADLGSSLDSFDVRWSEPTARELWSTEVVPGGAPRSFTAPADMPGSIMWVLQVKKRSMPRGVWLDDTFDAMTAGPLHGQNGWVVDDCSPTVSGGVVDIDPPGGAHIRINKDVPIQAQGKHRIDLRVMVVNTTPNANQPSMAKLELRTDRRSNASPKFHIFFGTSMRVHGAGPHTIVANTQQGVWYRIRCDVDLGTNQMDVYVNDVLVGDNLGILGGPITDVALEGWDMSGSVRLDEVRAGAVRFFDVPGWHPFFSAIEIAAQLGITGGCSSNPPLYCPDIGLTRAQAAVFLLRAKHGSTYVPPPAQGIFDDVPAGDPFARWIEQLAADGVTGGCSTNPPLFCPNATITREQMAVFLVRARYGAQFIPPDPVGIFQDVPTSSPFARWIEKLVADGVTGGCSGNPPLYCPGQAVTRGQMAVFVVANWSLP